MPRIMARQVFWVFIIVIAGGVLFSWWIVTQGNPSSTPAPTTTPISSTPQATAPVPTGTPSNGSVPTAVTVAYDGNTFSPQNVRVAQGGTVTWVATGGDMWVASDPSSLQNGYDGTTLEQHCAAGYVRTTPFDECSAGTSFSFIFNKVGTWGYHDHLNSSVEGSVTVVAQ